MLKKKIINSLNYKYKSCFFNNQKYKFSFFSIQSILQSMFMDHSDKMEKQFKMLHKFNPHNALVVSNKKYEKHKLENPLLYNHYDKVLNKYNQIKTSESDLAFINIGKNGKNMIKLGVPIINNCYYETLGVETKANRKQIRDNYIKIALEFHPDKNEKTLVNIQ